MSGDKLIGVCARAFNVDPASLTDASGPDSVPSWDSLGAMTLLAAIDEELGVRLPLATAARIKSIGDLRIALKGRGIDGV